MMGSPAYPITVVSLYLVGVVTVGPILMRSREAWNIKKTLLYYNTAALALNFVMGTVVSGKSCTVSTASNQVHRIYILICIQLSNAILLSWHSCYG